MPQFQVAIYLPVDFDPSQQPESTPRDIDALNEEMIAAGARLFAGGLAPVSAAKLVRKQPHGKTLVTDGPYTETKEHIGGFWILECPDLDAAVEWGRKAVIACRVSAVEVRAFSHELDPIDHPDDPAPKFLAAGYLPDDFDPSKMPESVARDIWALMEEQIKAGVLFVAGGLTPASATKTLRQQSNGKVIVTDGPYIETKEHIGGFSILKVADINAALEWARRGVIPGGATEIRPFLQRTREEGRSRPVKK